MDITDVTRSAVDATDATVVDVTAVDIAIDITGLVVDVTDVAVVDVTAVDIAIDITDVVVVDAGIVCSYNRNKSKHMQIHS